MAFESAYKTKKDAAERPFDLRGLVGSQITIEEDLNLSSNPRTCKKEGIVKATGKAYSIPMAAIKASDGMFEKDLQLSEAEWRIVCTSLPNGLRNWRGVMLKISPNPNKFDPKVEYLGIAQQDMNGNAYNKPGPANTSQPDAPTEQGRQILALTAAMDSMTMVGWSSRGGGPTLVRPNQGLA